jgi:murein DD-endopeptidase MepM/ murein hydrolase activator NlpD
LRSLSCVGARPELRRLGRATIEIALLAVLSTVAFAAAPAAADSGGGAVGPPAKSKTKLLPTPKKPARRVQIADVRCAANPDGPCLDVHRAERGARLQVRGRNLSAARQVVFYGARGAADDVTGPVQAAQPTRVVTTVPAQALSGPVGLIDSAGRRSPRWDGLIVDIAQSFSFRPAGSVPGVQVGLSQPRTIFFGGMQKAIFNFQVTGTRPLDVRVDLVRLSDGIIVQSWQRPGAAPGVTQRVTWNGAVRGRPQPQGRYSFRLAVPGVVGARAEAPPPDNADAITLMGYVFPIKGAHQFGTGAGRFGAARRGHRHQGQDTFARCGTSLVAARGGKVIYAGYQSLAGYYVAIDGAGTGVDFMYAHLRQPPLVATGDNVYSGQQIGEVGDTGDAVGCHLHFEEWTAPGWYKGGHPYDPLPDLKRWDSGAAVVPAVAR